MNVIKKHRKTKIVVGLIILMGVAGGGLWIYGNLDGDSPEWGPKLRAMLVDCDRLRVRTGGLCHRRMSSEVTLFEITGASDVAGVVANLKINSSHSGFHCMCCGNPTFEFYRDESLVAAVGFHHGKSLRWQDWRGDGLLQAGSASYLESLMKKHGYHIDDGAGDL